MGVALNAKLKRVSNVQKIFVKRNKPILPKWSTLIEQQKTQFY